MSHTDRPGDHQADVDNTPPPAVSNTYGWMIYWDWLILANDGDTHYPQPFLIAFLTMLGFPALAVTKDDWSLWWIWPASIFLVIFLPLRAHRKRELQPVEVDPYSGDIRIVQTGQVWPWFIGNSATDTFSLDDEVITPGQTRFEQLFGLDSETILLPKTLYTRSGKPVQKIRALHRVRGVNDILAIRSWRRKQPQRLAEHNNALQEQQLKVLEGIESKLAVRPPEPKEWRIM